jgi:hypothetical protein
MSSLNSLSSSKLVHLVFEQNGKRHWFNRTDRRRDASTGQWATIPVVDDDPRGSSPMNFEFAVIAQERWKQLGFNCRFALEPNGPFVDADPKGSGALPWTHDDCWVTVNAAGEPIDDLDSPYVYPITAVHTPAGKQFVLKFQTAVLQNQSQFSSFEEGPDACVRKAFERGYTKLEPPQGNPFLEARRLEAQRQAQRAANARFVRVRPGDTA